MDSPANFWGLLDETQRAAVLAAGTVRRSPAGEVLMREGDHTRSVVVLRSGLVKIVASGAGGHEAVLAVRGPGDALGEMAAVDHSPRSATAVTLYPVEALWLDPRAYDRLVHEHPGISGALLRVVTARLRYADVRRVEHGDVSTSTRLAALLVDLVTDHGVSTSDGTLVALNLSQTDLAGLIGASRESVILALKEFRDGGVLSTGRQRIVVHRPDLLRECAGDAG
jgi:CRP-like cAMP-binding protein